MKQNMIFRFGIIFVFLTCLFFLLPTVGVNAFPQAQVVSTLETITPSEPVSTSQTPVSTPIPGTGTPITATETAVAATAETTQVVNDSSPTPEITNTAILLTTTPTGPTRTPLPAFIDVQPRRIAGSFLSAFLIGIFGILAAWLAQKIVFRVLFRVHAQIQTFASRFTFIGIIIASLLWILSVFNVNPATLATLIGSLGLALSLSAQDLFKNLVAGIYLLIERPFFVGDEITIGAFSGRVEVVDIRTISLRTEDDQLVIVPNTMVLSQIVVRKLHVSPKKEPPSPEV